MTEILNTAILAAQQAGASIQQGAERLQRGKITVEQKSLNDFVSEVDRDAEQIIRDCIAQAHPEHAILGEEYGDGGSLNADYLWIIDPLDGTTNFLRGIPHYAVSIAVQYLGKSQVGVVYDPVKNEMFIAVEGQGATLNHRPISVTNAKSLRGALLATGVPFSGKLLEELDQFTGAMTTLLQQQTSGIRRLGAAALDLAYVAAGRYDGFWEANLKPWDIAAGALIVQEAGGSVSDFGGQQGFLDSGNIVACPEGVHAEMCKIIGEAYYGR